mmetsp:Transcript_22986/g.60841  ORF Transcript_22986/g.60841 Transcript_22986/m.60841 type:complete len:223 (+) Transcript_22986:2778-3446(+)
MEPKSGVPFQDLARRFIEEGVGTVDRHVVRNTYRDSTFRHTTFRLEPVVILGCRYEGGRHHHAAVAHLSCANLVVDSAVRLRHGLHGNPVQPPLTQARRRTRRAIGVLRGRRPNATAVREQIEDVWFVEGDYTVQLGARPSVLGGTARPARNERINHTLGERVKRRNRRTGISPSALSSQPRRCAVMKEGEHWLHARFIDHVDNLAITRHRDGLDTQRYGLR